MNHEAAYVLMMDALDGELTDNSRAELEVHLHACPTCTREWQALLAIDTLLRQTPALSPAADFAQRTLARLPNRRFRLGVVGAIYSVLIFSGLLPLAIGVIIYMLLVPATNAGLLWQTVWQSLLKFAQLGGTVLDALFDAVGQLLVQEPAIVGVLLVMAGIISIWGGVYQQLMGQPRLIQSGV